MTEHWWLSPEVRGPLAGRAPLDIARWIAAVEGATVLSSDRQSVVALLRGDPPLLVKWRVPRPGRWYRVWLRASRERQEARAALRLSIRGIRCPLPWAVAERRRFGLLQAALLIRRYRDGLVDARRLKGKRLLQLGHALRGWHDAGFRHGDCYPKNVLTTRQGEEPMVIGCPKARFLRAGPRIDRPRKRDLAQWAVGCKQLGQQPFAFLEAYTELPGMPVSASLREMVRPLYERILKKKARRLATQAERESRGRLRPEPIPYEGPPGPRIREDRLEALVLGDPALDR